MPNLFCSFGVAPGVVSSLPREPDLPVLLEANVGGVLTEAATADVERVLADQTTARVAHTAARKKRAGVRNDTGKEGGVCERGHTRSE